MTTCSVCGGPSGDYPMVTSKTGFEHAYVGNCARELGKRLAALESAQRPQPAPPGGGEPKCDDCGIGLNQGESSVFTVCTSCWVRTYGYGTQATPPAPGDTPPPLQSNERITRDYIHELQAYGGIPLAPGDATGGDEELANDLHLSAAGNGVYSELMRRAATRLDELRRERDEAKSQLAKFYDECNALRRERDARLQCTRAWAVANQRADEQKSRADGGRDVLDKLDELRRERGVITIGDGLRVGRHWVEALQARADDAEAKVDKLTDAIFWALGEGGSDFHKHVGPNQPQYSWRARLRELMKDALTTPAQRSESNDGG
jgi:hypothetical protein